MCMGVYAGLIRYPADVFDRVRSEETFYPPNGRDIEHCHLDRSWDELHPALATFGVPLSLALSGDYGHEGGLQHFGCGSSESDHYLGFVSPPLVRDIAVRLGGLAFEQLATNLSEPGRETDYLAPRFKSLVAFYTTASADGNCVFIHVA
jgi:hypothetical protein